MAEEWIVSVYSKKPSRSVAVRTVIGEYSECGENHGKKVYQRLMVCPGHEDEPITVHLYFWDGRDGQHLQGWWFGKWSETGSASSVVWSNSEDIYGNSWALIRNISKRLTVVLVAISRY